MLCLPLPIGQYFQSLKSQNGLFREGHGGWNWVLEALLSPTMGCDPSKEGEVLTDLNALGKYVNWVCKFLK